MSALRFRFDPARLEPLLRELATESEPQPICDILTAGLEAWPGVALCRVWLPGSVHLPFGSRYLEGVSRSGSAIHVRDRLLESDWVRDLKDPPLWMEEEGLRGLGAHPWGQETPYGVILVFTRVPLERDAFVWLGRVAVHATLAFERGRPDSGRILTAADLKDLERRNLSRALAATGGKIFGADGAAALLGMKPTTLASRIKALEIPKPQRPRPSTEAPASAPGVKLDS